MLSDSRLKDNFSVNNFKEFSLKSNLTTNKIYLKNAYGHEIQYYNDDTKKIQNRKRYFLVAGSVVFVIAGAIATALATKKVDINALKTLTGDAKLKGETTFEKIANSIMTWANFRDDCWDRFATFLQDNTPFKLVKNLGDKLTNFYLETTYKGLSKRIGDCQDNLTKMAGDNKELLSAMGLQNFNLEKITADMRKTLKENRISKSMFSFEKGISFKDKILTVLDNMTSPFCDNTLSDVIKKHSNIIDIEQLKKLNATDELIKEAEKYNSLQMSELFPKLRDINCGSAPNDVVCASIPILSFMAAALATKDKEKRDSMLLNIGIPLVPTCLMPFVGLKFPILNGFNGFMAGFAVGQVFKQSVKLIDKKINGENELNRDVFDKGL